MNGSYKTLGNYNFSLCFKSCHIVYMYKITYPNPSLVFIEYEYKKGERKKDGSGDCEWGSSSLRSLSSSSQSSFGWSSGMSNEEVRSVLLMGSKAITTQAQAMTTQENRSVETHINPNMSIMASRLRDYLWMNPLVILWSKVGWDPQEFVDEVFTVVDAMGMTSV